MRKPRARIVIKHDPDCPLGVNGLEAHAKAAAALSSAPPEARATAEDMAQLVKAWRKLESKQVCRCGGMGSRLRSGRAARKKEPYAFHHR
jgi:hypothetical protein